MRAEKARNLAERVAKSENLPDSLLRQVPAAVRDKVVTIWACFEIGQEKPAARRIERLLRSSR